MKAKYFIFLILILFTACKDDNGPENLAPEFKLDEATDITRTTATLKGSFSLHGNAVLTELHFCYGINKEMDKKTDNILNDKPENSIYSAIITGLTPNKTYYYCLEGSNGRSMVRSEIKQFTTEPNIKPVMGEITLLSKGPLSAIAGFCIKDNGGEELQKVGCYIYQGDKKIDKECPVNKDNNYIITLSGLEANSSYSLQAYSCNNMGESLSNTIEFTTSEAVMLTQAGQLPLLMAQDMYQHEKLSINGPMNGDDFCFLRNMMGIDKSGNPTDGILKEIDITDVHITEGGESYDLSHFISENEITSGLFGGCKNITKISLPNDATSLDKNALSGCISLKEITIPASISKIIPSIDCTSLESITVSGANNYYSSIDGILFDKTQQNIVWFPMNKTGEFTFPNTLVKIEAYAFQSTHISKVILPESLTDIGKAAFYKSEVTYVAMPAQLRTIPSATFQDCNHLTTVYLGENTSLISDYVFDGTSLTDLYIKAEFPPICNSKAFGNSNNLFSTCRLHVPAKSLQLYKNSGIWKSFSSITAM